MPLNTPRAGINYAGEFQSSALPWVTASVATSSATQYSFPNVSRFITLTNHATSGSGQNILLGFTQNGVNGSSYIKLEPQNQLPPLELRVKEVWVKSSSGSPAFTLLAGLTNVSSDMMPPLTGTLVDNSAGWQGVG